MAPTISTFRNRNYVPVVIIGAGRSGTNMLRDVLTSLPGLGTWPCDEINYIWRHGNARRPTDEFTPQMARPRVKAYVRRAFDRVARGGALSHVVEKTCANSLRVAFVDAILPEARFVHIVRDGRDVAVSAAQRWTAALDVSYLLKKVRFVPPGDLPYYGARYAWNRICRLLTREKRLACWGPRFAGMEEALRTHALPVACALQWQRCVERAAWDLAHLDPARVFQMRYEEFVRRPADQLRRLLAFLHVPAPQSQVRRAVQDVSPRSVGRWAKQLDMKTLDQIDLLCGNTLRRLDYRRSDAA